MIRILTDVLAFIFDRLLNRRHDLSLQDAIAILKAGARRLMRDVGLGFVGIALGTAGFLVGYFDVLTQLDLGRGIVFGAVAIGGGVLILLGAALIFFAWKDKRGEAFAHAIEAEQERHRSPLEQALSALLLDIVKEREFNREQRRTQATGNGEDRSSPFAEQSAERKWENAWP